MEVAVYLRTNITRIRVAAHVIEIPNSAFRGCRNLVEVYWNEGLQIIGKRAFQYCPALRRVAIPSTVTKLGMGAFFHCSKLVEVTLNEGLQVIGEGAFKGCAALQSVTIPLTVTKLDRASFHGCSNLIDVIFLGGERLLKKEFLERCLSSEGVLDQKVIHAMIGKCPFGECPELGTVKISTSWALSERMTRLPHECRLVFERIRNLPRLELTQDGNIFACFHFVDGFEIQDTKLETARSLSGYYLETARSLHRLLQLIAFHELKESSILIELAMWKSKIDEDRARAECRLPIPDPAKSLIMEYCGFAGFLEPAIEGNGDHKAPGMTAKTLRHIEVYKL